MHPNDVGSGSARERISGTHPGIEPLNPDCSTSPARAAEATPAQRRPGPAGRAAVPGLVFGVVLLAAGASVRMGRPKLLLSWGSTTVLGHLLTGWRRLGPAQIAVVLAKGDRGIPTELDRLAGEAGDGFVVDRVVNPEPARGMFSSIRAASAWTGWNPAITHWLVSLGDQPQVRGETGRMVLMEASAHRECICQPSRQGRPRHPVVLPGRCFRELSTAGDENLKEFLLARAAIRHCFESDDPGLDVDLDFPADYERARELMD